MTDEDVTIAACRMPHAACRMPLVLDRSSRRRWSFAAVVVARRRSLGLTLDGLAERAGCDSPSLDRVFILADALGVSLAELFDDFGHAEADV